MARMLQREQLGQQRWEVGTIADMLALSASENQLENSDVCTTRGHTAVGLGSGEYRYDSTSTATIDGIYVLPGSGGVMSVGSTGAFDGTAGTGRWFLTDISAEQPVSRAGVEADGTTDQSGRILAMIAGGVRTLLFDSGLTLLTVEVPQPSVLFKGLTSDAEIQSALLNQFAVTFSNQSDLDSRNTFGLERLGIRGATRTRHGVNITTVTRPRLVDCWFHDCGIGAMINGAIDGLFERCNWRNCYVGLYLTSRHLTLSIPDVAGQTVTFTATPAITGTQSTEHTFIGSYFDICTFGLVVDAVDKTFPQAFDITFLGSAIQACTCTGIWARDGGSEVAEKARILNAWFEGNATATAAFDGETPAEAADLRVNSATIILESPRVQKISLTNSATVVARDVTLHTSPTIIKDASSTFYFDDLTANLTSVHEHCDTLRGRSIPGNNARALTQPSNKISFQHRPIWVADFVNVSSNDNGSPVKTSISDDGVLPVIGCEEISTVTAGHGLAFPVLVEAGKVVVTTFSLKAMDDNLQLTLNQSAAGDALWTGGANLVRSEWRHFVSVRWIETSGIVNNLISSTVGNQVWRISAFQCHMFPNWEQAILFQKSKSFYPGTNQVLNVTADNTTDTFTAVAHGINEHDRFQLRMPTVATGLTEGRQYFAVNVTNDTFQVAESEGGTPVDFSSDGASISVRRVLPTTL